MIPSLPASLRDNPQPLPRSGPFPNRCHVFQPDDLDAVDAALAACRPLLLRGESEAAEWRHGSAPARHGRRPARLRHMDRQTSDKHIGGCCTTNEQIF